MRTDLRTELRTNLQKETDGAVILLAFGAVALVASLAVLLAF
jgi:hypothetical protein